MERKKGYKRSEWLHSKVCYFRVGEGVFDLLKKRACMDGRTVSSYVSNLVAKDVARDTIGREIKPERLVSIDDYANCIRTLYALAERDIAEFDNDCNSGAIKMTQAGTWVRLNEWYYIRVDDEGGNLPTDIQEWIKDGYFNNSVWCGIPQSIRVAVVANQQATKMGEDG